MNGATVLLETGRRRLLGRTLADPALTLDVVDPENGRLVGTVGDCSAADVDEAVRGVARAVLAGPHWPRVAAP